MDAELQKFVDDWMKIDPDEKSKAKVNELIAEKQFDKLRKILNPANRLEFGTAGLRGEVSPGYCCMN